MKTIQKIGCIGALVASLLACEPMPVPTPAVQRTMNIPVPQSPVQIDEILNSNPNERKTVEVFGEITGYGYGRANGCGYIALTLKGTGKPLLCSAYFRDGFGTAESFAALVQHELRNGEPNTVCVRGKYHGNTLEPYRITIAGHELKFMEE